MCSSPMGMVRCFAIGPVNYLTWLRWEIAGGGLGEQTVLISTGIWEILDDWLIEQGGR